MSKIYYPREKALNNIVLKLKLNKKNAYDMTIVEIKELENELEKYIKWTYNPNYMGAVPVIKKTGEMIIPREED